MDRSLSQLWKIVKDREVWHADPSSWGHKELDTTKRLNNNKNEPEQVLIKTLMKAQFLRQPLVIIPPESYI